MVGGGGEEGVEKKRKLLKELAGKYGEKEARKRAEYEEEKRGVRRIVRRRKREVYRREMGQAVTEGYGNKEFWRWQKKLMRKGKSEKITTGEWKFGEEVIRDKGEAGDRMKGWWEENARMKRGNENGRYNEENREWVEREVEKRRRRKERGPRWCEEEFGVEDIEYVMDWLVGKGKKGWVNREGKACGEDGVCNWMMTKGGEGMKRVMVVLANLIWEWEEMPTGWSRVRVKYLYKGGGDRRDYDRSRPVSLISCVGKIR